MLLKSQQAEPQTRASTPPDLQRAPQPASGWRRLSVALALATLLLGPALLLASAVIPQPTASRQQSVPTRTQAREQLAAPDHALGSPTWVASVTAVVADPGANAIVAHLGPTIPLTLGESRWIDQTQWYAVTWQAGVQTRQGWTPATTLSFTAPTNAAPTYANLDALSPELAAYVAQQGPNLGVAIQDVTRNQRYGANQDTPFLLASSAKVYILCGYLDMLEGLGRRPNSVELAKMNLMITQSDNNAAFWLFAGMNRVVGQQRFLDKIGVTGYVPAGINWGYSELSPAAMVRLLALLQSGGVLTAPDRELALSLLGHIDNGVWGVGDTAPQGATVYMKDGWVSAPDGAWAQNSSGIVKAGGEIYIVSVYTQNQPGYTWATVRQVCAQVARLLV